MSTTHELAPAGGRLVGTRVLVTRPKERAQDLCFLLEDEGAEVVAVPLLELIPPLDPRPLQAAAERVQRCKWVLLTSPSAVQALVEACRLAGTVDRLRKIQIGVVGPATARAVRHSGLEVTAEADGRGGLALFEAIREAVDPGDEVLLPIAEEGRRELQEALEQRGVLVSRVVAYRTQGRELAGGELRQLLERPPDAVLFGSPRTVEALLEAAGSQGREFLDRLKRVAIGPTTARALEELALPAHAVAGTPSAQGLVDALIRAVRG